MSLGHGHGLLEGVSSYKHVWKTLDAAREASSFPHDIELDDSIDAAMAFERVIQEVSSTLSKKAKQREPFVAMNVDKILADLQASRNRLETLSEKVASQTTTG